MKKLFFLLISLAQISGVFAQELAGTFRVVEVDTSLLGSYFTFEFQENNQFTFWSRECKSVDLGTGVYKIENDSITFEFDGLNSKRSEVYEKVVDFESGADSVTFLIQAFQKIRIDTVFIGSVNIKGPELDTTISVWNASVKIKLPRSPHVLSFEVIPEGGEDKIYFQSDAKSDKAYELYSTYMFDGFVPKGTIMKYKIEKSTKKKLIFSTDGAKMKFEKTK